MLYYFVFVFVTKDVVAAVVENTCSIVVVAAVDVAVFGDGDEDYKIPSILSS